MNESSGTLLAGLVWLRLAGIVVLAISAALGIATTVFVDTQLATYSRTLDGCTAAQDLLVTSAGATRELRFLLQCARQWLNCSAAMVAARQATISVAADAFSTEHRGLYDTAYQVGYQDSYEAPVVPVNWYGVEVDSAVEVYEVRTMSLYEAGLLLAAALQAVAVAPLVRLARGQPDTDIVLHNGFVGTPIHDVLNATIYSWLRQSGTMRTAVTYTSLVVYVAMVVMVVAVGAGVVLPILVYVERTRDRFLLPLLALPTVIPATLRAAADRRLKAMRAADADVEDGNSTSDDEVGPDDDGGDMDADGGVRDGEWEALASGGGPGASGKGSGTFPPRSHRRIGVSGVISPTLAAMAMSGGGGGGGGGDKAARRYRKSFRSLIQLAVKFILPLLAVFGFFTVTYFTAASALTSINVTQQFDAVARARMLDAVEVPMLLRGAYSNVGAPADVQPFIDVTAACITSLEYHHRLFSYVGTAAEDVVQLVPELTATKTSYLPAADAATLRTLTFGDACGALAAAGRLADPAPCRAFRGGIMTRGVNNGVLGFLDLARAMLARRQAASVTAADGVGTITIQNVTTAFSLVDELNDADMADIFDFGGLYLVPAMDVTANLFSAQSQASVSGVRTFLYAFLAAFLIAFAAYQVGVYLPQVHRTNDEIKSERVIMLLLPTRLLQAVPELAALMQRMLDSEAPAAAAAAAAAGGV